jgi:xylobiose transport system substrate-binding protein
MLCRTTRRVLGAVTFLTAVGMVAGCGTAGPSTDSDAGITVWALQDQVLNPIEKRVAADQAPSGHKVALETFGNDPYKQKLRIALGSPNAPDVFFNWGGGNLAEYVTAGKVADLSPMLEQDQVLRSTFLPNVLDVGKIDGKYYGLPMRGVQPVALFYNKKVFQQVGIQPPKTWDELLDTVDACRAAGILPISLAGSQGWTELMWLEYLLDRIGGPTVFERARAGEPGAWKDPAVLDAATRVTTLVGRGAFGDKFASVGYDVGGASTILAQGKAAMHLMGSWEYVNQLGQSPRFVADGDLGWIPFPAVPGGKGDPANVVGNPTNFYSVSAGSPVLDQAKAFVAKSVTSSDYLQGLIDAGDVPAVVGIEDRLAKAPHADYTTWIYDLVRKAPHFQLSWDQDLTADEAAGLLTDIQQLFLGKLTPEEFVDALSRR